MKRVSKLIMFALLFVMLQQYAFPHTDDLAYTLILLKEPLVSSDLPLQIREAKIKNYSRMADLSYSVSNLSNDELQAIKISLVRFSQQGKIIGKESWDIKLHLPSGETKEVQVDLKTPIKRLENVVIVADGAETTNGYWTIDSRAWSKVTTSLLQKKTFNLPEAIFKPKVRKPN